MSSLGDDLARKTVDELTLEEDTEESSKQEANFLETLFWNRFNFL